VGNAAADVVRSIDARLNGDQGLFDQLLQSASQLRDQALIAKNSSLDIAQRLVDLGQVVSNNTSPVKALLENWAGDVDVAMAAYVKAATSSMINTMNPAASALPQGAITPMVEWWDCYHLSLVGVPAAVGTGTCGFRGSVENLWAALESIAHVVEDSQLIAPSAALGLPGPTQIRAEIEALKSAALEGLQHAAIDALIDILPQEVQDLIALSKEEMTEERLRHYFTKPETASDKGLLMIPDVADRVKAEMYLGPAGSTFDQTQYAVIANAVALAKLALLDEAGLALLAQQVGLSTLSDGSALFAATSNLLADAFASIDGNHAWMPEAPALPSAKGAPYRTVQLVGYTFPSGYAAAPGFVPWRLEARDALFRALFVGPVSPGIDAPSEMGFRCILPADYPYHPCLVNPFPSGPEDTTCEASLPPCSRPTASAVSLVVPSPQAEPGASLILTVAVTGVDPSGAVLFFDADSSGRETLLGSVALQSGNATFTIAALSAGTHAFSARYGGDGVNLASTTAVPSLVQVNPPRHAPTADAGRDRFVVAGGNVTLIGSATDLDGDSVQLAWRQLDGPSVEISASSATSVSFVAPATVGSVITFELAATDSGGLTGTDTVVLTTRRQVRPPRDECQSTGLNRRCIPR
jgi:hypothetical protein